MHAQLSYNNFTLIISFSMIVATEILSTDPSLPRDVLAIEGGDAVFSCEFGTSQPRPVPPVLPPTINFKFVYHSSDDNFSQSIMTANCSYWTHCTQWAPHSLPYLTNISLIHVPVIDLSNYLLYRYEIHLTNVAAELNGSTFSCSVATLNTGAQLAPPTELVQWEGAAELFVALKDESTPSMISSDPAGGHSHRTVGLAPILVPLGVTVTLLLTISGTVVGLVAWKRHQTRHHNLTGKGNWEFLKSEEDL